MDKKPKIDFIGIGVNKCGTTWIAAQLRKHPQVCLSRKKETNFFYRNFYRGFDWYSNQFSGCNEGTIYGEFSPSYIISEQALERIKKYYPDSKLLIAIREPIDRLRSNWRFDYERGTHSYKNFYDYVKKSPNVILEMGLYGQNIEKVLNLFPKEKVKVVLFDDIINTPEKILGEICDFLAIDKEFEPVDLNEKINASGNSTLKFRSINVFIFKIRGYINHHPTLKNSTTFFKKIGVNWLVKKILRLNISDKPKKTTNLNEELTANQESFVINYYTSDLKKLSSILEKDIFKIWTRFRDN